MSLVRLVLLSAACVGLLGLSAPVRVQAAEPARAAARGAERATPTAKPRPKPAARKPAARKQVGTASIYSRKLAGNTMADGTPLNPNANVAASKTLPLGTTAKVTNLETGRSTRVTIQDRGPYVKGRIVDLSPAAAAQIGLSREQGLAEVEVAPITVPAPATRDRD